MSCNVLLHECTRHTRTLPLLTDLHASVRQTSAVMGALRKPLLRLMNARRVSMHEVDIRLSLGKLVPLGRLQ
jgi:hypothetical protein